MSKTNFCKAAPQGVQCIDDRADIAFFVDPITFSDPETGDYFKIAKEFYEKNFPMIPRVDVQSLDEIIKALNTTPHGKVAWGEVHIVAHGAEHGWYVKARFLDSEYKQRLIDLMMLREIQGGRVGDSFASLETTKTPHYTGNPAKPYDDTKQDEWTRPDLVDPATKIIINSCEVAKKSGYMLDLISDLFRGWPEIYGPRFWVFFRRDATGAVVRRFLRDTRPVVLPRKEFSLPLSAAAQKKVVDQLHKQHSAVQLSEVEAVVKRVKAEWSATVHADEWIKRADFNAEFGRLLEVDSSGALLNRQEAKIRRDKDGFVVHLPAEVITLNVTDADMPKKALEALNELFVRQMKAAEADFMDGITIQHFGPGKVSVETNQATADTPKHHIVRVKLDAVILRYFMMVMNKQGDAPVVPDHNAEGHFVKSTFSTRCADYYRVDKYRDKKLVDQALSDYEAWKRERNYADAMDALFGHG